MYRDNQDILHDSSSWTDMFNFSAEELNAMSVILCSKHRDTLVQRVVSDYAKLGTNETRAMLSQIQYLGELMCARADAAKRTSYEAIEGVQHLYVGHSVNKTYYSDFIMLAYMMAQCNFAEFYRKSQLNPEKHVSMKASEMYDAKRPNSLNTFMITKFITFLKTDYAEMSERTKSWIESVEHTLVGVTDMLSWCSANFDTWCDIDTGSIICYNDAK